MNDFRKPLYEKYITNFKKSSEVIGARSPRLIKFLRSNYVQPVKHLDAGCKILDVGCGSGQLVETLLENGYKNTLGIDLSKEQIESAQSRGLPVALDDALNHLSNNKTTYDVIFAIDFVEHFSRDELNRLGRHLYESLKDGGYLIIQTPNGKSPFALRNIYGDLTHLCIFCDESITQWLSSVGFQNITCKAPVKACVSLKEYVLKVFRACLLLYARIIYFIVTNRKERILTENLISISRK